jgi:hypothetical protein
MAQEIVTAEPGARQDLILDLRHTLVPVAPAESGAAKRRFRWLLFRAPAVDGSGPAIQPGGAPELWFELEGRRIECELRDAAGWLEREGAAVALYEASEAPVGGQSSDSGPSGVDPKWGLRWGSDEFRGELGAENVELPTGPRAGRG